MEMQVGEKFFQFNFQKNLKLSHNPHLPITRSGMHLMQNHRLPAGKRPEIMVVVVFMWKFQVCFLVFVLRGVIFFF